MFNNNFFKFIQNLLFAPIYFLIGLLYQIDKMFSIDIDRTYSDKKDFYEKELYDFTMVHNLNDFYGLEKKNNIYLTRYRMIGSYINKNTTWYNITTLRDDTFCLMDFYYPLLNLVGLKYFFENKPNLFTLYKLNTTTNEIFIEVPLNNNQVLIKEIIFDNYVQIINILEKNDVYNKNDFNGWEHLYEQWIKPVEPSQTDEYLKLTDIYIDKKNIVLNNIPYTQIRCVRNLLQRHFFNNLNEFDDINKTLFDKLSYLYTTYRINESNGNIITIIH